MVRLSCIPPVNTVPHGGQIIMHSTSEQLATWRSDHHAFHQRTTCHMAVRSSRIPPANNLPQVLAVRLSCIPPVNTIAHDGQIIVHSASKHSTAWRSDSKLVWRETGPTSIITLKGEDLITSLRCQDRRCY